MNKEQKKELVSIAREVLEHGDLVDCISLEYNGVSISLEVPGYVKIISRADPSFNLELIEDENLCDSLRDRIQYLECEELVNTCKSALEGEAHTPTLQEAVEKVLEKGKVVYGSSSTGCIDYRKVRVYPKKFGLFSRRGVLVMSAGWNKSIIDKQLYSRVLQVIGNRKVAEFYRSLREVTR